MITQQQYESASFPTRGTGSRRGRKEPSFLSSRLGAPTIKISLLTRVSDECRRSRRLELARLWENQTLSVLCASRALTRTRKLELRRHGAQPRHVILRSPALWDSEGSPPTSFTFIVNVRGQDRRYIHC